ncbi:VTC domain-containing protein [Psychrosphaera sp. G1-22]|uniref:VTC domain-containing protein n=1 Tax=Psychrosphaera algicola TaxID=3023714 RepID=A0ABT5FCK8_9GAMM|nr:VTC domain-containing protein [Psychrosphaera sp. G1-22]MDC2889275.1 VTC domain-containing protein [Psychrosphaera sp. G1-22]
MGARSFSLDLNILNSFNQHGLDDLKNAKLMNRVDSKFLLPMAQLPLLLKDLKPHCSLLNINGNLLAQYENVYYDTPEFDFYHQHHNGKLNRVKVRRRCYADHDLAFLNLKLNLINHAPKKPELKLSPTMKLSSLQPLRRSSACRNLGH